MLEGRISIRMKILIRVTQFVLLLHTVLQAQPPTRFSIGIVQTDGVLIPVASYHDSTWVNPWPEEYEHRKLQIRFIEDIPNSWLKYPLQRNWYLQLFSGANKNITITEPRLSKNHCGSIWGLLTNSPTKPVECDNCCPFPKIGFAYDTEVSISRMDSLTSTSQNHQTFNAFIQSVFDVEEDAVIEKEMRPDQNPKSIFHIFTETKRKQIQVKLTLHVAVARNGDRIFYFQAFRYYYKSDKRRYECPTISYFSGFVFQKAKSAKFSFLDKRFDIDNCDMKLSTFKVPYALIELDNKRYIFTLESGWGSETYMILEIIGSKIQEVIRTLIHAV